MKNYRLYLKRLNNLIVIGLLLLIIGDAIALMMGLYGAGQKMLFGIGGIAAIVGVRYLFWGWADIRGIFKKDD